MNENEPINPNINSEKSNNISNNNNNKIDKSLLEEQLKCPICNYIYDSDLHCPFIIKCGHTFCKQCVTNCTNNKCPIDGEADAFEIFIKNIQLEIIVNKFIYNNSNKTFPNQKQMIYVKPDLKRNKNIICEKEEEIIYSNLNSELPNRVRGKSNNQRFRNSDYKIYDNKNINDNMIIQNSPGFNKTSKPNLKKITPKYINNDDNAIIYTKKDNIIKFHQYNINIDEKNSTKEIKNRNNDNLNEDIKINTNEENFKFEDEKIGDMLINESIETIPLNEEKSFTDLSIREDFNDLLTKNEIYKKRIVNSNNSNNINNFDENKNMNNNIKYKSPCKKVIAKDNPFNCGSNKITKNANEKYFNEVNKKIFVEEMALTMPKQYMRTNNAGLNSDKELYTYESRQLTESNNNTEKKLKENKTFQNFFNSTNSNKTNSNINVNSTTNNGTTNKNVKSVFDYIQSISNKPSKSNNKINILEKNNEDTSQKIECFPNMKNNLESNKPENNNINNGGDNTNNKILKSNNSIAEMRNCKKYIKVRASSKISKRKSEVQNHNNSDLDDENAFKKNNLNQKINQIKVLPKRNSIEENANKKNNSTNKYVNLSTLYNKKKIVSQQNNSESINNSGYSLEKNANNGAYSLVNRQKPIEIKRKEMNSHNNQKNTIFNNNINNINIMISPEKPNNILIKNDSKSFLNNEPISKTINLSPINPYKDMNNNLIKNNFRNIIENNNMTNNINSIINLNLLPKEENNLNALIIDNNYYSKNKKAELMKARSQSTNKSKSISVTSKLYVSQNNYKNNNYNYHKQINTFSPSKTSSSLTKNEIINNLKQKYNSLDFEDKLLEKKNIYDSFFEKAIENPLISEVILDNINNNNSLNCITIKFTEKNDLFLGLFESDLITPKKGIILTINGEYYEGEFMNGKKDGKGKLIYKNGTEYIGNFKNNKHHGYGQLTQTDGEIFQGEWKDGKINGNGTRFHSNGDKYIGNYINNIRNGHGYYIFSNGDSYEGNWKDGKANGQGVFKYNNGNIYEGEFKDNLISGKGKFILKTGDVYNGIFTNGLINGKGIMVNNKGEKYVGYFMNGKKNGVGKLVNKNGKIIQQGYWKKDKFLGNKDFL